MDGRGSYHGESDLKRREKVKGMELSMECLTKQYGPKTAVNGISACLSNGVYGLLGANGAGKTTMMRMLCGILTPTSGRILCNGRDISEMGSQYREILGYLPQDFGAYPDYKAMEFMLYLAALKGISRHDAAKRCRILLGTVGLEQAAGKKIRTFSGGMKQRLGIAQAMLNRPGVLILDEPTAGLDPKERVRFRNLLAGYGENRIVLLSTHIVSDIEAIADQILLMKDGSIILQGTPQEMTEKVQGKVWELKTSPDQVRRWEEKATVANLRHENGDVVLRIISDRKPAEEARLGRATLEDLYLLYFPSSEGGE